MSGRYSFFIHNKTPFEFRFETFDTGGATLYCTEDTIYPGGAPQVTIRQGKDILNQGEESDSNILSTGTIYYEFQAPGGVKMENSAKSMWMSIKTKTGEVPVATVYYSDTYDVQGDSVDLVKVHVGVFVDPAHVTASSAQAYDKFTFSVVPYEDVKQIKAISVVLPNPLHPILNEKDSAPDFRAVNQRLDGVCVPCTIDLGNAGMETLEMRLSFPSTLARRQIRFVLSVRVEGGDWELCRPEVQYATTAADGTLTVATRINPYSQVVPWGFKSKVFWSMRICATGQRISLCQHSIELYAVSARLPTYFAHVGIPNELLRLFVLPTREKNVRTYPGFVKHVTETIHWKTGCKYARAGGSMAFGYPYTWKHTADFDLKGWLAAIRERRENPTTEPFKITCWDLGPAVQTASALGLLTAEQEAMFQWHYMEPFGLINATHLIGWDGECNDPFIENTTETLVDVEDDDRTYFGNHVFVSYDDKVYDATCGPALGTDNLAGYLEKAIDRGTTLYTQRKKFRLWPPPRMTGGVVKDVSYGVGVRLLKGYKSFGGASREPNEHVEWFKDSMDFPLNDVEDDLVTFGADLRGLDLDSLGGRLEGIEIKGQKVKVLHFSRKLDDHVASLTWVMKDNPDGRMIKMVIHICDTEQRAVGLLSQALQMVHGKPSAIYDLPRDPIGKHHLVGKRHTGSGHQMLVAHRIFLTIDGLDNSEALEPFLHTVQEYLSHPNPAKSDAIDVIQAISPLPVPLDGQYHYPIGSSIMALGASACVVHYATGNVFVTQVETSHSDGTFSFTFVARGVGLDIASIHFTDPSYTKRQVFLLKFVIEKAASQPPTPIFYMDGRLTFRKSPSHVSGFSEHVLTDLDLTKPWAVTLWVRSDQHLDGTGQVVWGVESFGARGPALFQLSKDRGQWWYRPPLRAITPNVDWHPIGMSAENLWYHIVVMNDGVFSRFYINGEDCGSMTHKGLEGVDTSAPLRIAFGRGLVNPRETGIWEQFDGAIWRPRVWQRQFTREEVKEMCQGDLSPEKALPEW